MQKYTCPCCGYKTIERADTFYDLCPVCFWETDPYQLANPTYKGGANVPSLAEAQQNFILFGACEKEDVPKTRMPFEDEIKDVNFQTFDENTVEDAGRNPATGGKGVLYFKRYWNETTGDPKTDAWGTSWYYFETDAKGEVSKQMVVYKKGGVQKYSALHLEDAFGGLSEKALDLSDDGYKKMSKSDFFALWNTPFMDTFSKNKIHLLGWHLAVFNEKIMYPNPVFKEEETLISATLDHRFMLDLTFEKGGEHWPKNGSFTLKIKEGNTWVHFFNYMNWDETVTVTQRWINEIQVANKTVDIKKAEEEKSYNVRVTIDNQLVMSKLTTWRNMDWDVEKFRNIQIEINDETYSIIDTFTDFENMLLALHKSLPKNYKIETCFFCRFSSYNPVGNDNFGALDCFKNCKKDFEKVDEKHALFALYEKENSVIFKVEETHYCEDFKWIKTEHWAVKNMLKD
jgi:Cysteine-rich CPCC